MPSARAMLSGESSAVGNAQDTSMSRLLCRSAPTKRGGGGVSRSTQAERLRQSAQGRPHVVVAEQLHAHVVGARCEVLVEPGGDRAGVALRDELIDEPVAAAV